MEELDRNPCPQAPQSRLQATTPGHVACAWLVLCGSRPNLYQLGAPPLHRLISFIAFLSLLVQQVFMEHLLQDKLV